MKPYKSYKESHLDWVDNIPTHWFHTKIKYLSNGDRNSFIDGDWIESPYIRDEGIRLIQTGNIGVGVYKEQGYLSGKVNLDTKKAKNKVVHHP